MAWDFEDTNLRLGSCLAADAGVFTCITKHNKGRLVVVSGEIQNLPNGCVAGDNTCNGIYKSEVGLVRLRGNR